MSNGRSKAWLAAGLFVVLGAASMASVRGWHSTGHAPSAGFAGDASVAGTILDLERKPIGSARVCAHPSGLDMGSSALTVCSTADASGRYRLAPVAAGRTVVSAFAEGFEAGSVRGVPLSLAAGESRAGLDIALQRGGAAIQGTVVDATGRPVPHARVRGECSGGVDIVMAIEADDVGRFTLSPPPGPVVLAAAAETYAPARTVVDAPSVGVRLALVAEARVRGAVVFADGKSAPNVEVRAAPMGHGSPFFQSSRTDGGGAFDIHGLEPGTYVLVAAAAGLRGEYAEPIELYPRRTVDDLRIEVHPVAQVLGRVLFEGDDRPCDRGQVTLGPPDLRQPPAPDAVSGSPGQPGPTSVVSDIEADGAARFPAVPPGQYLVSVNCSDHVLKAGPRALAVGTQTLSNITWRVGRGASLHVLAVDDADRPIAHAGFSVLYPQWAPGGSTAIESGLTDGDGQYDTGRVLSPGLYHVSTGLPPPAQPVAVDVREGADVRVKLEYGGNASIDVSVQNRTGGPLDGLTVFARPAEDAPSAGRVPDFPSGVPLHFGAVHVGLGQYRIAPLTAGRYEVRVEDGVNQAMSGGTFVVSDGKSVQGSVELDRGGRIRGRVLDERGAPIADASVQAIAEPEGSIGRLPHAGPQWSDMPGRVLTDGDGRFAIDGLSSDGASYELRVEAPGHGAGVARGVRPGEPDASMTLPPPGSVAGVVVDGCGDSPVRIVAANMDSGERRMMRLPPSNRSFIFRDLAPGHFRLEAACSNGSAATLTTELSAGQNVAGLRLTPAPRSVGMSSSSMLTGGPHLVRRDEANASAHPPSIP